MGIKKKHPKKIAPQTMKPKKSAQKKGAESALKSLRGEVKKLREKLAEVETQESAREVWGYVGHEIKNYAAMILTAVEEAERIKEPSAIALALKIAREASSKLLNLAESLRNYSQGNETPLQEASPVDLLDKTASLMQPTLSRDQVHLVRLFPVKPKLRCDTSQLEQVFINLLLNARDALAERPNKEIRLESQERDGQLIIRISDNGCGMSDEVKASAFKPFYSTKKNKHNYGIGLAVCRDIIVKRHGGRLRLESTPGVGTSFTIILPL